MKFTSALSTVLVLLPAFTNAIAIPAQVDSTNVQRRGNDVVAREIQDRIVARQNRNGQNRNGQNRNGQNRNGQNRNGGNRNNQNAAQNGAQNAAQNAAQNGAQNAANQTQAAANQTQNAAAANQTQATANQTQAAANQTQAAADQTQSAAAADQTQNAANQNQAAANQNQNQNNNQDPQESLTLLAELVAPGLALDGQDPPVAGQVASLTSTNNFINFCLGQTITNGQQIREGSCNPVPMGDIIPKANMPSSKFTNPINFSTIPANQPFVASIAVQNMNTGFFTNAQKNYFAAPQQLDGGVLVAHSHIVIQQMQAVDSTQVLDPLTFAFFKGLNAPAVNGVLSADVTDGLAAGVYRMASIHTSANHAPAVAAVAQHGFFDDIVYFTVQ
jgi:hypothetical protein